MQNASEEHRGVLGAAGGEQEADHAWDPAGHVESERHGEDSQPNEHVYAVEDGLQRGGFCRNSLWGLGDRFRERGSHAGEVVGRGIGQNSRFRCHDVAFRGFLRSPGEKRGLRSDRDTGGGQGHG